MKQVLQNMRTGVLRLADVPVPALRSGGVVVRTHASVISAGTERYLMDFARKSYLGKARERPDLVKQVMGKLRKEGVSNTYRAVMSRLDTDTALGYSCAGVVTEVAQDVDELRVGDLVACSGFGIATHSEVNFVPKNLVVKVPEGLSAERAAYGSVGAIALQGVRTVDPRLGEGVVVIGLGLIGLLAMQVLEANGVRAIGIDLDPAKLDAARRLGFDRVVTRSEDVEQAVMQWTGGLMADAVLITAGSPTADPLELGVELLRKRGRLVVLGNVPLELPHRSFYGKELELRISTSLGPGRYDPVYELDGVDYPLAYVRWTERRNLAAFLELLVAGKVDVDALTTHRLPLDEAERAYAIIEGKVPGDKPLGVVFEYPRAKEPEAPSARRVTLGTSSRRPAGSTVGVGFIGAGPFARGVLLPAFKAVGGVSLEGICTASGTTAEREGQRQGFRYATTDYRELLDDSSVDLIVVATPHRQHARMVVDALDAGKHVFVEKPLAVSPDELPAIRAAWEKAGTVLHVGFNRRFSPFVEAIGEHFRGVDEPLFVVYRINAGYAPPGTEQHRQGGRIVGEGCHFIDTLVAITGSRVERLTATTVRSRSEALVDADSVTMVLQHEGGHLGTIHYLARGSSLLPKEHLEVHGGGRSAVLNDYTSMKLFDGSRPKARWKLTQDKGHKEQIRRVVAAIREGGAAPVPFEELMHVTEWSFRAAEQAGTLSA